MKNYILILQHLSYIMECFCIEAIGEAKGEIVNLKEELLNDHNFKIKNGTPIANRLNQALELLHSRDYDAVAVGSILSSVSKDLWKKVMEQIKKDEEEEQEGALISSLSREELVTIIVDNIEDEVGFMEEDKYKERILKLIARIKLFNDRNTVLRARLKSSALPIRKSELLNTELEKNTKYIVTLCWKIRSKAAPHSGACRHPIPEHAGR